MNLSVTAYKDVGRKKPLHPVVLITFNNCILFWLIRKKQNSWNAAKGFVGKNFFLEKKQQLPLCGKVKGFAFKHTTEVRDEKRLHKREI